MDAITRTLKNVHNGALDYAVKHLMTQTDWSGPAKVEVDKEEFRELLSRARGGRVVSDQEVDLIYAIFDSSGDGALQYEELRDVVKKDHER